MQRLPTSLVVFLLTRNNISVILYIHIRKAKDDTMDNLDVEERIALAKQGRDEATAVSNIS